MMETPLSRRISFALAYVGFAFTIYFVQLLPLKTVPSVLGKPDVLFVLTVAWMLRRPDLLPIPVVAFVLLCGDLLLQRPPGLFAGFGLCALLFLRTRAHEIRRAGQFTDSLVVWLTLFLVFAVYRLALVIAFLPVPTWTAALTHAAFSMALYPILYWILGPVLGVREVGSRGPDGARVL